MNKQDFFELLRETNRKSIEMGDAAPLFGEYKSLVSFAVEENDGSMQQFLLTKAKDDFVLYILFDCGDFVGVDDRHCFLIGYKENTIDETLKEIADVVFDGWCQEGRKFAGAMSNVF